MYTPIVIENNEEGERSYDLFSRLMKDRIIRVDGCITSEMASIVTSQLLFLESRDPNAEITMYINSIGGEVCAGLAIYDTMNYIQPDVRTIVNGDAMSMGSVLLMGGTPGKRHALPNSEIMIHQPSGGTGGKASDMQIGWEEMRKCKDKLIKLYMKHCNKEDYAQVEADLDRDNFMTPEEAKEYGIIDSIFHKRNESTEDE